MPLIYFSRVSKDREEFFFAEMPTAISQAHDVAADSTSINEGEATSSRITGDPACPSSDFKLQYEMLPHCLKSCLDYCSCITFKYSVDGDKLVRLLLAEGLVPLMPEKIMEEVAEMIIQDLMFLGMLRQELLLDELKIDENYKELCLVQVEEKHFLAEVADSPVRALVYDDGKNIPPNFQGLQVSSLFIMTLERRSSKTKDQGLSRAYMESVCSLHSLLVFDLEGKIGCMPDGIGNMVHLRYLGLYHSGLDELPPALFNLQELQTLDIRHCRLGNWHELPVEVLKIKQLRHLLMSHNVNDGEITVPKGFGAMENLHTCDGVYGGGGIANDLGNLIQLRKLGVKRVADDHSDELAAAITKMTNLTYLDLEAEGGTSEGTLFPEMEQLNPPPLLGDLRLSGGLSDIPSWIFAAKNLTTLKLSFSRLLEHQTWVLQSLPKLKHLTLWNACDAKYMNKGFCSRGGFLELETLLIASLTLVEWSEIEEGAFPSLRLLTFRNCVKLKFLPDGLQNISTIEQLCIFPVYNDIARRLTGEENYKIKHIENFMYYPCSCGSIV